VHCSKFKSAKKSGVQHQSLVLFYFQMQLKKKFELKIQFFLLKFLDQEQNDANIYAT